MMNEYKSLFSEGLVSPETKQKAIEELNETVEKRESSLHELRKLITENNTKAVGQTVAEKFLNARDETLLPFLRSTKFDVPKTYTFLEGYTKYRDKYPGLMKNLTFESVKDTLLTSFPAVIPTRTKEGQVAMVFSVGQWKPDICPIDKLFRACIFMLELLLRNEETQINGLVFIENYDNFTIRQMFAMTPNDLRKMVEMLQGAFPGRFKGIHVINQPWYFSIPMAIMRPFLNKKLESRIFIHGHNRESFHAAMDVVVLPASLGGSGPEYDPKPLIDALEDMAKSER